jgi:acetyl-CoA synthetase (ADP-forming)
MTRGMSHPDLLDNLHALFNPSTVAVIGASENSAKLGYHVMKSLKGGSFEGRIVPVNPGAEEIMGTPAVASILSVEGQIDLAVIVLPASAVMEVLEESGQKGVKAIVCITAGFKEIDDPAGTTLQQALAEKANACRIPVIGPNTFGVVNLHRGLNASFTPEFSMLETGPVALVSQSGGISHLLAFMAMRQDVRIGKVIGLGNRLNIDFAEMTRYLEEDPDTGVILLYLEGLDDPRGLMEVASTFRGRKPIIAYKTGRGEKGDQASRSHTGALAGSRPIYKGALKQSGIFFSPSTEALLDLGKAMAACPLPRGPRVAILSGQAGPAMAACDVCQTEGLEVTTFDSVTQETIHGLLPPLALRSNPVDMGPAWYDSEAIRGIVRAVMVDGNVDGILILMMFASANREVINGLSGLLSGWNQKKPVVGCLVSPPGIWDEAIYGMEREGALVNLPTPERAANVLAAMWKYAHMLDDKGWR